MLEEQILSLAGLLVVIVSFFLVGQAYYKPIVRAQGVQSFIIGMIAVALYVFSGKIDYLILGIAVISLRSFAISFALERAIKGRFGFRESVKGVASLLIIDLIAVAFFFVVIFYFESTVFQEVNDDVIFGTLLLLQGLMLSVLRKGTIPQIIGYVEEENGIVLFGTFLVSLPLLIEASALLDVLGLIVLTYIIIREKPEHDNKLDELVG